MPYSLDDFFRVRTEVSIAGRQIVVRALGDVELQACRRARLLAALARRKELKDDTLGEKEGWERDFAMEPEQALVETLRGYKVIEAEEALLVQQPLDSPIVPDDATREEEMEALGQRESVWKQYRADIRQKAEAAAEAVLTQLKQRGEDALRAEAMKHLLIAQEQIAGQVAFNRSLLRYACSQDGKPMFQKDEDVGSLPSGITNRLMAAYIEVQGVDVETLEDFFETASSSGGAPT